TTLDGHDDALLHLVADHDTLHFDLPGHGYFAFSLRTVFTRASFLRASRRATGFASWPIALRMRSRNSSSSISAALARRPSASISRSSVAFIAASPRRTGPRTWSGWGAWRRRVPWRDAPRSR